MHHVHGRTNDDHAHPETPPCEQSGTRPATLFGQSGATIVGPYRYDLWRQWDYGKPSCLFVMLNPSTADALVDDPTIRRCRYFAAREGCGRLVVVNLFAVRSTNPVGIYGADDPVGPDNDAFILNHAGAQLIIAAWGSHGSHNRRDRDVMKLLAGKEVRCLGVTAHGQPRHPLYIPNHEPLKPYGGKP